MFVVTYYEMVLKVYHGTVMARLRFATAQGMEESAWLTIPEVNAVLFAWRERKLLGSFGVATVLAEGALCQYVTE